MISITAVETMAKELQLHSGTLRAFLTGQRQLSFEEMAELERRMDALGWNLRPLNGGEPRRQAN